MSEGAGETRTAGSSDASVGPAGKGGASVEEANPDRAQGPAGTRPASALVLLALGLIWLAAYLWAAHASIDGAGSDPVVAVIDAALALPGVIAATMLAGTAAGVALLTLLTARRAVGGWPAAGFAIGAGVLIGALAGGLILLGYGHRSSIVVLAWTVLAAGAVGGLLGSLRPRVVVASGLSATIVAFFLGFALNYKQERLLKLFGAGSSTKSQVDALTLLTLTQSVVAGVIAGIVAYLYLRRARASLRFPAYLAAGAMPGVLLLLAELVTWIGGRQLLGVASGVSTFDQVALDYSGSSRLNHGLVMLFVGGIVAMVAFGRTLGPKGTSTKDTDPKSARPKSAGPKSAEPKSAEPKSAGPAVESAGGQPSGAREAASR